MLICALAMAAPTYAQDIQKAPIDTEQQAVSISMTGTTAHVKYADGMVLEVFSLTGARVCSYKIDSADKAIELNSLQKGCYILKVGKTVRKVIIK